ncbi:enoyl-CoA hydratase/isomerase family protein [uncultured Desulfosarcina sp.]|uniref:enoyl-CoA hydratase/isomerase family protein n=1 Tax=uncultured Desulfosarcina sp. TaxID=218289 RepID=UPI0029C8C9FD|nr:enoyl-CoA hydratase/isomerase family protein [uncultured Desulfosarcina sp.]
MSYLQTIQHTIADGIATLTLDRPKHNVLNIDMMTELNGQLDQLATDGSLKCIVIAANGPSWCAGVEVADHKPAMVDDMIATFNGIFERIHRLPVPTIAAVQGACLGGGMEVAMACDIIIAAHKAVFGQPEIKLGFFPPYAAIRLPQLVGPARAVEICTTGRRYKAEEAHRMGLVSHLSGDDNFQETVDGIVGEIKACSPLIVRLNKRAVTAHLGLDFKKALSGVSDLFLNTLMKTEDTLEGIASFEEKRRPVWKNR